MGADGSLPVRLTTNDDLDAWAVWSPDGTRIVFQSDQESDLELYVIASGGGPPKRLTESPGEDAEPAWG
jgi:Tol biopolymer transport system component